LPVAFPLRSTMQATLKATRTTQHHAKKPALERGNSVKHSKHAPMGSVAVEEMAPPMDLSRLLGLSKEKAMMSDSEATIAAFEAKLSAMQTPDNAGCTVIDPRTEFRKKWDIVMIVLLLFTATVTPWEVGMGVPTEMSGLFIVNQMVNLAFIFDMVMNFMLAYQNEEGAWVMEHSKIAKIYMKSWFILDFVSVLPFDTLGLALDDPVCAEKPRSARDTCISDLKIFRVIRLLRLLKLLRILRASRIFKRWEQHMSMSYSMRSLVKFLVYVIFLAHWIACVHRLLPQMEGTERLTATDPWKLLPDGSPELNWMDAYGIDYMRKSAAQNGTIYINSPTFVGDWHMYTVSLYWSCMTLSTIGYGDIPVRTHSERVLAIFCMILGAGTYAYMVGAICGIVASMDQLSTEFNQTMDSLNDYMREMDLPQSLKLELRGYFFHCKHLNRIKSYRHLLEGMSTELRGSVTTFVHGEIIGKVYFFNVEGGDETRQFVSKISMFMEAEAFSAQETVIARNSVAEKLYMVDQGLASKEGQLFTKGTFFGEDFILTEARRHYHVLAVNFLDVYTVHRDDLQTVLEESTFPNIRRKIRLAMVRLAFMRRIRPYIFQLCTTFPDRFKLPESMRSKEPVIEALKEVPSIVRRGSISNPMKRVKPVECATELAAVVDQAKYLAANDMAALMGCMGKALASLGDIAAEYNIAPGGGFEKKAATRRGRRMSGIDLDDQRVAMDSPNGAAIRTLD